MDLKKLRDQLVRHEGLRFKPYVDTVGKITIGVGHNLTDKGITASQATLLLIDDITDTINLLNTLFDWFSKLDDVRARAIADLTFDVAHKIVDFTHMISAIEAKDWDKAADHLLASKFATQTGKRAKDLAFMLRTGQDVS